MVAWWCGASGMVGMVCYGGTTISPARNNNNNTTIWYQVPYHTILWLAVGWPTMISGRTNH